MVTALSALLSLSIAGQLLAAPDSVNGGEYPDNSQDEHFHLTEEQRWAIERRLELQREKMRSQGVFPLPSGMSTAQPEFVWPVVPAAHVDYAGVDAISNYVDNDANFPDQILDYNCGGRSYDLSSGYNHSGIDIFLWPFSWQMMEDNDGEIVAAAPGIIIGKDDGNNDQSCGFGGGSWNAVYVEHGDGSIAWYGHMKKNSLTTKNVGDSVVAGEFLGVVGSSGNSTGPHLHMEVYDASGNLIDPYAGSCNVFNAQSWWKEQPDYYEPAINRLATGTAPPSFNNCPTPATTNFSNTHIAGTSLYMLAFYRDQLNTSSSQLSLVDSTGSTFDNWSFTSSEPHYAASYWFWNYANFTPNRPRGGWTFNNSYNNTDYSHEFFYVDTCDTIETLDSVTVNASQTGYGASNYITTANSVSVTNNADLALVAGNKVVLNNGFSVASGSKARIDLGDVCS